MEASIKIIVVGLGIQGKKRSEIFKKELVATVDPYYQIADYEILNDVPLDSYDSALVATPDENKYNLIKYLVLNSKHVIVEKPLMFSKDQFDEIAEIAIRNNVVVYTAYNHRFEPHVQQIQQILKNNELGQIYSCKLNYGNGTARLVKNSPWRDTGMGVLGDLGSHLLDTIDYWFGLDKLSKLKTTTANFENKSPDFAISSFEMKGILFNLEMSLCSWKNSFFCEIIGEKGSLNIHGLCKWGPSILTHRTRVFPSGIPLENTQTEPAGDPTWVLEYIYFKNLIRQGVKTSLIKDCWINESLLKIYDAQN